MTLWTEEEKHEYVVYSIIEYAAAHSTFKSKEIKKLFENSDVISTSYVSKVLTECVKKSYVIKHGFFINTTYSLNLLPSVVGTFIKEIVLHYYPINMSDLENEVVSKFHYSFNKELIYFNIDQFCHNKQLMKDSGLTIREQLLLADEPDHVINRHRMREALQDLMAILNKYNIELDVDDLIAKCEEHPAVTKSTESDAENIEE